MDDKKIKGIGYGVSDYSLIRMENDYYVDKTNYLAEIETCGRYLFFIRPRRFGKSLFLSMMEYYYDVLSKDRFDELFKGTWIYDHPTPERHRYLVLPLNFSALAPDAAHLESSFLDLVRGACVSFIAKYRENLSASTNIDRYLNAVESSGAPADILRNLNQLVKEAKEDLYVIIDEYDNFSNTILTVSGEQAYRDLTHGDGFFRSFFNVLKAGTGGSDSPIKRLFITGGSPITMDDVTSGFNIGKNVSLFSKLHQMLGFTQDEVKAIVDYYKPVNPTLASTPQLMEMLTTWYGNYRFSGSNDVPMFNADMVLYFIDYCLLENQLPGSMIDRNVRIDYGKLRHLIVIDRDGNQPPLTNGNFSKLKQIIEEGGIVSDIADGFSLEEMTEPNNFNSLLFYFGLLTIADRERGRYRLSVPNQTVKSLYYDFIKRGYKETGVFWGQAGIVIAGNCPP